MIATLDNLLASLAAVPWWVGLKGLSAADKARSVLARLHASAVTSQTLLEVGLAVAALVRQRGISSTTYLNVQIAKVLVRMHAPDRQSGWQPSEASARTSGRWLQVLGKQVWFFAWIVATENTLAELTESAQPGVAVAARAEDKRKAKRAVRQRTEAGIKRAILQARHFGAGPHDLARLEARLRERYGLKAPNHVR